MMKSANWQEFLLPTLRKIVDKHVGQLKDFVPVMYTVESSNKAQEFMHQIGSVGQMKKWGESGNQVYYEDVYKGYKSTWEHDKWSIGLTIERELLEDTMYQEVKARTKTLADSIYHTRQAHAVAPFNECRSAIGPDGVPLAATNHPVSPQNNKTWSNFSENCPLNADNVEEIRNEAKTWTDDKGNKLLIQMDTLIVPSKLRKQAKIIADTDQEPDTAMNNVNIWKGAVNVIEWDFLDDPDMWFFVDMNRMKRFLYWFERRKPTLAQDKEDFDTEVGKYKVVGRWSLGPSETSFFYACKQ